MDVLSAAELLDLWERGRNGSPLERALGLLEATERGVDVRDPGQRTIGERDAALLSLRQGLFGDAVTAVADCPSCGERMEIEFALSEFGVSPRTSPTRSENLLEVGGYTVSFRLPTSADLMEIADEAADTAKSSLLARCLVDVAYQGNPLSGEALPHPIADEICERMSALDPGAEIALSLQCSRCGERWSAPFDIASFLWDEVAAWSRRTLYEVHTIAAAYGWTQEAILRLSAWRRRAYFEMVVGG